MSNVAQQPVLPRYDGQKEEVTAWPPISKPCKLEHIWTPPMAKQTGIRPRVKVWLEHGNEYVFGWGIAEILTAVESTGSIKEAAKKVGKSYRHVWSRVKAAERSIGKSLVETRVGGKGVQRSELTAEARELLQVFIQLRHAVTELVEKEFAARFKTAAFRRSRTRS